MEKQVNKMNYKIILLGALIGAIIGIILYDLNII